MRHGRAKAARRTLQFYKLNAPHLTPPYKILLDGTFLVATIRNKVPLFDRLEKTLQHEPFTCYVARSTLDELDELAKQSKSEDDGSNVFQKARQFGLDECEIIENGRVPNREDGAMQKTREFRDFSQASRDIHRLATDGGNNRLAYFVATQDDALSDSLRARAHVPLFRLGRAVLLLESPSSASRSYTGSRERAKLASAGGLMTAEEREMVSSVKRRDKRKRRGEDAEERRKAERRTRDEVGGGFNARRKKKARGPNPLSCKKKKTAKS